MTKLRLDLPALPNVAALGGNARRRLHWSAQRRATQEAQQEWWALILKALGGRPRPRFQRARAEVTLVFATRRKRDMDGLETALKPLWDVLSDVPKGKELALGYGYRLGIIPDDDREHLEVVLNPPVVDPRRAPRTVLVLEGLTPLARPAGADTG